MVDATLLDVFSQVSAEGLSNVELVIICGEDNRAGGWQGTPAAQRLVHTAYCRGTHDCVP